MHWAGRAGLLCVAVCLGAHAAPPERPNQASASAELAAVLAAADEADLDLIPQNALSRGDLLRAGDFGDLISDAHLARAKAQARDQLQQLRRVDRSALSAKERIAYDVFRYQVEYTLRGHELGVARMQQKLPLDHVFGAHVTFAQTQSGDGVAPYKTVADYDSGLQRIDGYVRYLERAIEQMRKGLRAGIVQPRVVVQKVIAQLDREIAGGVEGSPYLQPVGNFPSAFTAPERERLQSEYRRAIGQRILPQIARLSAFMKDEYLPASRGGPPGLTTMPGGGRVYAYALEQHNTTRMTAADIHRLGLSEVSRIRRDMERVRRQVGFAGSLDEFFGHLQNHPRFKFESPAALLARYDAIRQRIDAVAPRYFAALPKGRFQIKPYPPEQQSSGGGAYYVIGTPDGERPGAFYVNLSALDTRTSPRMTALLLHETVPGHHLQGMLAQEDASLPALLRFSWNPGYTEGWGLYSEWLGAEMGLYDDPYQHFGRLDMEMIRAVRLVVDTGLHARGWSRDRALRYMARYTSLDAQAIEQEVDRYIVWPGQATAYKVGELFIRGLRNQAQTRLGARFDLREFHRQVLDTGSIPLPVLQRKIDNWVTEVLSPPR